MGNQRGGGTAGRQSVLGWPCRGRIKEHGVAEQSKIGKQYSCTRTLGQEHGGHGIGGRTSAVDDGCRMMCSGARGTAGGVCDDTACPPCPPPVGWGGPAAAGGAHGDSAAAPSVDAHDSIVRKLPTASAPPPPCASVAPSPVAGCSHKPRWRASQVCASWPAPASLATRALCAQSSPAVAPSLLYDCASQ